MKLRYILQLLLLSLVLTNAFDSKESSSSSSEPRKLEDKPAVDSSDDDSSDNRGLEELERFLDTSDSDSSSEDDDSKRSLSRPYLPRLECVRVGTHSTRNHYSYKTVAKLGGKDSVVFQVKARNDAHIALSSGTSHHSQKYEIVIGGWGNKMSVIRYRNQGHNRVTARTHGFLNGRYFLSFWVSWKGGYIRVGRGRVVGRHQFMAVRKIARRPIRYMMVSTGWGADGKWKICKRKRVTRQRTCIINVGNSYMNVKRVRVKRGTQCARHAGNRYHRVRGGHYNDRFDIRVRGSTLLVKRLDASGGWGMRLAIRCNCGSKPRPVRPKLPGRACIVHVGNSHRNTKRVRVGSGTVCKHNAGNRGIRAGGGNYNDRFYISKRGNVLSVRRLDWRGGWGMRLSIRCRCGVRAVPRPRPNYGITRAKCNLCRTRHWCYSRNPRCGASRKSRTYAKFSWYYRRLSRACYRAPRCRSCRNKYCRV